MKRKMLINAKQAEEMRLAVVEDRYLQYLDLSSNKRQQKKGNIYKASISRIEQSLNAVFVSYGSDRHGFLPIKEIAPEYFTKPKNMKEPLGLKDVLKEGQELIIQVQKEERGNKGAAVTTYISLPGTYVVLMPNNDRAGGVSRSIDGPDRSALKSALNKLNIPGDFGVIIRTAGLGRTQQELQWDLDMLVSLWYTILDVSKAEKAPKLIYQETDLLLRAVRDYLRDDISEIIVDNQSAYEALQQHIKRFRPEYSKRLKLYDQDIPLFSRYQVEAQIELAYQREITLSSGGAIVIDHTEALTSIDINSAKATKGADIEETALKTNLEAAKEIARQLRIRDLGGLVVIDFIDMGSTANKRKVEKTLLQAIKQDKARVQVGSISSFGLLEMSRQRIRPSLQEISHIACPRCNGKGAIRSVESLGLSVIRHIRETSLIVDTKEIQIQLPVSLATFLLNEKRDSIVDIESSTNITIVMLPNPYLETPEYQLTRIKLNDEEESVPPISYTLVSKPENAFKPEKKVVPEVPSIKAIPETQPPATKKPLGLFRKLYHSLFTVEETRPAPKRSESSGKSRPHQAQGRSQKSHQNRHKRGGQRHQQRPPHQKQHGHEQRQQSNANKPQHKKPDQGTASKSQQNKPNQGAAPQSQQNKPNQGAAPQSQQNKPPVSASKSTKPTNTANEKRDLKNQPSTPQGSKKPVASKIINAQTTSSQNPVPTKPMSNKPVSANTKAPSKASAPVAKAKSSPKKDDGSRVEAVLKRSREASKNTSTQIESAKSPVESKQPQQTNLEQVVQQTKAAPAEAKKTAQGPKSIAVETKAKGALKPQNQNLSIEVAVIGEKTSAAPKAKRKAPAKPRANVKTAKKSPPKASDTRTNKPAAPATEKPKPKGAVDGGKKEG